MILEDATYKAFGYEVFELSPKSDKPILAACDSCGKIRTTSKAGYRALCKSCAMKGANNPSYGKAASKETKALQSAVHKGKMHTEESKALMSTQRKGEKNHNFGKRGEESSNFKGGKKAVIARKNAKRRKLGSIHLNSYFGGCEGHHITRTFIIYIPAYIHRSIYHNIHAGRDMLKINVLALKFLLNGF